MFPRIYTFCFPLFFCIAAAAQTDTAKLNRYFEQLEKKNKAMGSVCLYADGTFVYDKAIGFADVEANKRANINTVYRIGSISKVFTAVMILQLMEENKLTPDTRLSSFYPGIKNSANISIEHLLRHRSGIGNFTDQADYTTYMERPKTEGELIHF